MSEDWRDAILSAVKDFSVVSQLAGQDVVVGSEDIEFLPAPHAPRSLPIGRMAVYGFWFNGQWLKIGQAGPNSNARYTYQHYSDSAGSTLLKSLRKDPEMRAIARLGDNVTSEWAEWIKRETSRANVLLPSTRSKSLLSLLESFLHVRLNPRYEG